MNVHTSTPQHNTRRSLLLQNLPSPIVHLNQNQKTNNDELERSIRRTLVFNNNSNNRFTHNYVQSPVPSDNQIREHFQICLKMYAENKISAKNVWNLKLIDYMRNVLIAKTQNTNATLQIAGTSLDAGSKIYGIRVDDIHSDGLKLASNMARTNQECIDAEDNVEDNNAENPPDKAQKRKRPGQQPMLAKNPETLLENINKVQSTFFQLNNDNELTLTSNLITNTLPMHYNGHKYMLLSTEKAWQNSESKIKKTYITQKYPFLMKHINFFVICQPFADFEIDQWNVDKENMQLNQAEQEIVLQPETAPLYELDQTLPNICDDGADEEIEENEKLEYITSFNTKTDHKLFNNYSFNTIRLYKNKIINRIWAGPSHWKLKYIQPIKSVRNAKKLTEPKSRFVPRLINFEVDGPFVDKSKLYKPKTEKTEFDPVKCTLPQKINLDYKNRSFLLKPLYYFNSHESILINSSNSSNEMSHHNYENNVMECSIHEEMNPCQQQAEQTNFDCLVDLPEMVQTTYVPLYTLKDKQMNMKKLKETIWAVLCKNEVGTEQVLENNLQVQKKTFSHMYEELPTHLNQKMKDKLSSPLAFVALLHVANEKNLLFTTVQGNDFLIEQQKQHLV